MGVKINFTNKDVDKIKTMYTNGYGTKEIGAVFNVSKTPINTVLKNLKILRKSNSDGKKIILTSQEEMLIKDLYLKEKKNVIEISKILNKTESFIDKFLSKQEYRRSKSEATSLSKLGGKLSEETKNKLRIINRNKIKNGVKKQTGGVCKYYSVSGLTCQGNYEKHYIEQLILTKSEIPENAKTIETPYGLYTADFETSNYLIEIKSNYTYDVLIGLKKSRFTNKIETNQFQKIKWVNDNVKKIQIIVIDIRKNKQIIKDI